jgi:hypothetical protein
VTGAYHGPFTIVRCESAATADVSAEILAPWHLTLPAPQEGNAASSSREFRPQVGEHLIRRNRADQPGIKFAAATLYFVKPGLFYAWLRRAIELLQKRTQYSLLFNIWKSTNLSLYFRHWAGHNCLLN